MVVTTRLIDIDFQPLSSVLIDSGIACRQVNDLLRRAFRFHLAGFIREADDRVIVSDVKIILPEGQAKGTVQSAGEGLPGFGDAVFVGIPQNGDLIGPAFGDKDIAIRRQNHPARMIELLRERSNIKAHAAPSADARQASARIW